MAEKKIISTEEESADVQDENPGDLSDETQHKLEEKQKEFEFEETHMAREGLKEDIKQEKFGIVLRWVIAGVVAIGLGFLYWYLIL